MDNNDSELEVNKKNREQYEQLMKDSSTKLDGYFEKDNLFVKVLLIALLVIIALGSLIIILPYVFGK